MNKNVLIVEDDAPIRESLRRVLENSGYEVIAAADGQEALEQFSSREADIVILDLNLPIQPGWEIFEVLTRTNPLLPVIIITGMPNQFEFAQAAGAGALLEKPIDVPLLMHTIEDLLSEPSEKRLGRLCGFVSNTRYALATHSALRGDLRERANVPYKSHCQ
jgi:DNA-binding response OmpR family regulator